MMIELLTTKLRKKLLVHFFEHSEESFYVREIAEDIMEDPGNLSRELRRLEKEGLFLSRKKGNMKIYSLNKNYSFLNEIRTLFSKVGSGKRKQKDFVGTF